MKMNTVLKATAAFAVVAMTCSAAQADDRQAAMWQGAYLGVHVGGDFGKFTVKNVNGEEKISGIMGGLHGGYNWQAGSMVYGIEGDASLSGAKKTYDLGGGVKDEVSNGFLGSVRARLGYTTGAALFYGTGGLAFASFKDEITLGAAKASIKDTRTGYVLGLGMEYAISSNMSARIEALHYGFKDVFKDDIGAGLKYDANVVRAGVSYKF
jgi:outer membrane immunogenic protein